MPDKKFDLGDYVEVKDRIRVFYELFGQGRLVTENYQLTREPDDKPKVIVTAAAYRTPADPYPGIGHSWMYLPGSTSYTKGSELENVETSAWGRAIGSLGILIDRSIASANEVESKQDNRSDVAKANDANVRAMQDRAKEPDTFPAGQWQASGIASRGKAPFDGELRQTPEGGAFGFRIETPEKKGYSVLAEGPLSLAVSLAWESLHEKSVRVSGTGELVPWSKVTNGVTRNMPPYRLIRAEVIESAEIRIPASPETLKADDLPTVEDDVQNELFHSQVDEAEIDGIVDSLPR